MNNSVVKNITKNEITTQTQTLPNLSIGILLNQKTDKKNINPLSVNPTKWPNTLKQSVRFCQQIVWMCLTISWGWRLNG